MEGENFGSGFGLGPARVWRYRKKTGRPWSKIKSWFSYVLHVVADTRYEVPLEVEVTKASATEVKQFESMPPKLFEYPPQLTMRFKEFSADRGLDSGHCSRSDLQQTISNSCLSAPMQKGARQNFD